MMSLVVGEKRVKTRLEKGGPQMLIPRFADARPDDRPNHQHGLRGRKGLPGFTLAMIAASLVPLAEAQANEVDRLRLACQSKDAVLIVDNF